MNQYIYRQLENRFASDKPEARKRSKAIIDLALEAYKAEANGAIKGGMDPTFKEFATSQIKLFLFAGHDTTSASIYYAFYLLSCNPQAAGRLRDEHN